MMSTFTVCIVTAEGKTLLTDFAYRRTAEFYLRYWREAFGARGTLREWRV